MSYFWSIDWKKQKPGSGEQPLQINSLKAVGKGAKSIYATAKSGLFISKDQGKTFKLLYK